MNSQKLVSFVLILILSLGSVALAQPGQGRGQERGNGRGQDGGPGQGLAALNNLPKEDLNDFEKESLQLMREEEKLARDVYLTLGQKYDTPVFSNIPQSEQRHMDQLGLLLERYDLEDPIQNAETGKFNSKEMQKLYNQLVAQGNKSEVEALKVGATIEDLDIYDLEKALAGDVDNQDIKMVYANLNKGSRNHMRAFLTQLKTHGESYEAQYISQADLDAIGASKGERGPAQGKMEKRGRKGMNKGQKGRGK